MKSKSIFGLLMNPFERIAGWQAFGLGLILILLMGFIGAGSGIAFDGVFDMHMFEITVQQSFSYLAVDIVSLVLVMWITGLIVSNNFRFIDILGTMTLMYKALKVSCDLKGSTLTVAFIIGLFVSEIIAKILIHFL